MEQEPILLADTMQDQRLLFWSTIIGLLGTGIGWALSKWSEWKGKSRAERLQDEETAIRRLENLVDRGDVERRELMVEVDKLRQEYSETKALLARAIAWIKHQQVLLKHNNIPHLEWSDDPTGDTGNHASLQSSPPPPQPPKRPKKDRPE